VPFEVYAVLAPRHSSFGWFLLRGGMARFERFAPPARFVLL
jgi:hypothetical protein